MKAINLFSILKTSCYPSPYNELKEVLPPYLDGWYSDYNAQELKKINPKVVVELGSWLGLSTCDIARMIPSDAKIYAVDHFLGCKKHHTNIIQPVLYKQFLSNIIQEGLTHKIIPLKTTTREAAVKIQKKGVEIDLIYVDADHETDAVYQDLCDWYPLLSSKGVMCGDDWLWDSVQIAVKEFAQENTLLIGCKKNFWQLLKND